MTPRILLPLVAGLALCHGCGRNDSTLRLTYSVFFPAEHVQAKLARQWCDEIETQTEGRVKITLFSGGILTKPDHCFQGVLSGISDIGMSAFAYTRGRFPLLEGLDLPVGYPDGATATRAANALLHQFQPGELQGVHPLYLHAHGPGILATRRDVHTLDDLRNLKIRATGFTAAMVAALGGTPIGMPQNDTFEALQKGVVDATFCPLETLKTWNQGEVINSVTDTRCIGYTTTFFVVMNAAKWASLPPDIQDVFTRVSADFVERHAAAWDAIDNDARDYIAGEKKPTIPLPEAEQQRWRDAVAPVVDAYLNSPKKPGLPRVQFIQTLRDFLKPPQQGRARPPGAPHEAGSPNPTPVAHLIPLPQPHPISHARFLPTSPCAARPAVAPYLPTQTHTARSPWQAPPLCHHGTGTACRAPTSALQPSAFSPQPSTPSPEAT